MSKMHYKEKDQRLKSLMQLVSLGREQINFDQFCDAIKNLLFEEQVSYLDKYLMILIS